MKQDRLITKILKESGSKELEIPLETADWKYETKSFNITLSKKGIKTLPTSVVWLKSPSDKSVKFILIEAKNDKWVYKSVDFTYSGRVFKYY